MSISDLFDRLDEWFLWGGKPPEKVRKARENLEKAQEEYQKATQEAWEEQLEKGESALALPGMAISFGGSEEEFQASVERLARANPKARVEAKSVNLPNGYYRSVRIEEKG